MKLISMTDFSLDQSSKLMNLEINILQFRNNILNYAKFLKQPLELWMFVPCDEDGNVLNEFDCLIDISKHNEWFKSKEKCLFDGFQIYTRKFDKSDYIAIESKDAYVYFLCNIQNKWIKVNDYRTVECLVLHNLQLTKTAIKKLGL